MTFGCWAVSHLDLCCGEPIAFKSRINLGVFVVFLVILRWVVVKKVILSSRARFLHQPLFACCLNSSVIRSATHSHSSSFCEASLLSKAEEVYLDRYLLSSLFFVDYVRFCLFEQVFANNDSDYRRSSKSYQNQRNSKKIKKPYFGNSFRPLNVIYYLARVLVKSIRLTCGKIALLAGIYRYLC